MKLFSPKTLHRWFIKEHYDIEISYLEGPSARIISGCTDPATKLVSWIHVEQHTMDKLSASFRSSKEAVQCYNRFDQTMCVSKYVHDDFCKILDFRKPCCVLYNTVESSKILELSKEAVSEFTGDAIRLIAVGTLKPSKGYERLLRIIKRLCNEQYSVHLYILGEGPMRSEIENYITENHLQGSVTLLGYQINPYKYVARSDLFVCASFAEGFSTAATEALIVGTPVVTTLVSGMQEMLGENNEYGIITDNDGDALYEGIRRLLDDPALLTKYREKAVLRGKTFNTENTVRAVETYLQNIEG